MILKFAIVVTESVEDLEGFGLQGRREPLEILVATLAPLDLGESAHSWKQHILKVFVSADVFGPKVGLDSENVLLLGSVEALVRLIAIDFLYRKVASDRKRLLRGVLALVVVEIAVGVRGS